MAVEAWDHHGKDITDYGEPGELVCVRPFPCKTSFELPRSESTCFAIRETCLQSRTLHALLQVNELMLTRRSYRSTRGILGRRWARQVQIQLLRNLSRRVAPWGLRQDQPRDWWPYYARAKRRCLEASRGSVRKLGDLQRAAHALPRNRRCFVCREKA